MKFKTTILQTGNNTGIPVPADIVEELGAGKKPAVVITIGTFSYRSSIASMGGQFLIPLSADRRKESGLKGGEDIEVDLVLDTAPREVAVPADFQAALDGHAAAKAAFEKALAAPAVEALAPKRAPVWLLSAVQAGTEARPEGEPR